LAAGRDPVRRRFDPAGAFDSTTGWKRGLIVVLFLLAVLCILVPELVFQDRIFVAPDTKAPLSFRTVGREALDEGVYPLWNPYIFCGMPSYGSLAYTPYVYPVSFVTHVLYTYLRFPEMTWLLVHFLLAGIGMYLLSRSYGARPSISLLAGAVFMIMPNLVAAGAYGHGSQASAVAWMPLALLLSRGALSGRRRVRSAALLSIVLGLQTLRGHIQITYYTFLLIGLLFVFETVAMAREGRRRDALAGFGLLAGAFVLAVGIAAVLVFPVRHYAAWSIRGGGEGGGLDYGYATGWSLHPKEIITFVFPWAFGFGKATYWGSMPFTDYPNYLGIPTAAFALIGAFIVRGRHRWFLVTAALAATLIAFGKYLPVLYDPMFKLLPWFDKFRVPVMVLIVQQLAVTVLAAVGLERFLSAAEEGSLGRRLAPGVLRWVVLGCAVLLVFALVGSGAVRSGIAGDAAVKGRVQGDWLQAAAEHYSTDLVRTIFVLTITAAIAWLAAARRLRSGIAVTALAVVAVADLVGVDSSIVRPERTWHAQAYRLIQPAGTREELTRPDETMQWLSAQKGYFRIFPVPAARIGSWSHNVYPFSDNSWMMSRIFSLGGYHAAKLKNYQDVMDAMFGVFNRGSFPLGILDMLGARYFVSVYPLWKENPPFPLVFEQERSWVYENSAALPRAFFVDRFRVLARDRILDEIATPRFDPAAEALLEREPAGPVESAAGSSVSIVEYGLNRIRLAARVERPCIMVLSEIYYPDWRATVDGRAQQVMCADYCLRALTLDAGDHEIVFEMHPDVLRRSLALSIASLAIAVLAAAGAGVLGGRKVA